VLSEVESAVSSVLVPIFTHHNSKMTEEVGFLALVSVVKKGKLSPAILSLTTETLKFDYLSCQKSTQSYPFFHVIGACSEVSSPLRFSLCLYAETRLLQMVVESSSPGECDAWVQRIMQAAYPEQPIGRRIAVLVNPISGKKKGVKTFRKCLLPMLEYTSISCAYFETDTSDFVPQWCRNTDLSLFSEIVLFGGDGLLNQLLNGLAAKGRLDIPIGVIPCGSQNALACSIGCKNPFKACLHTIKCTKVEADLLKLSLDGTILLASSATAWGIVSDIVVEAQSMRQYGTAVSPKQRYALCGIKKMVSKWKEYRAKVKFIPADSYHMETLGEIGETEDEWRTIEGPFQLLAVLNHSCASSLSSDIMSPNGHLNDGLMDLLAVHSGSRMKMVKLLVGIRRNGDHITQSNLIYVKVRAVCIEPETTHWFNVDGEPYQCDRLVVETMPRRITYLGEIQ